MKALPLSLQDKALLKARNMADIGHIGTWPTSATSRSSRPSICPGIDPSSTPSFTSSRPSPPTRSTRSSPSSTFSSAISSKPQPENPLSGLVIDQMGIGTDQRGRDGIASGTQIGGEGGGVGDEAAGRHIFQDLLGVEGVGAEHRLAQAVLDHVAKDQPGKRLMDPDPDAQGHRFADIHELRRVVMAVQQRDLLDDRFQGAGN